MRLIFTHNNADFDAIASLMALHKLDPTAVPVLPTRTHRNVEDFLTLYASLLPAVPWQEIQTETIEFAYLVDTQKHHLIRPTTPTHIIDHHPLKIQLAAEHIFLGEVVGATTTLLTERLQREELPLTPLEATLLTLGIYEDTGSLTYTSTTSRDVRAAAWLLEHGAKLDIVRDFLGQRLENDQLEVYEHLCKSATMLEIQGHNVLVASASVDEQISSLSSIVHQLSNLYDPHALFAFIQVGSDVQMIARSGVEQIDVGEIARQLGGGGHNRAAAALIHDSTHETVAQQVIAILGHSVRPSVTVANLMSTGHIETITHDAKVSEAAHLMQMSGHEGYPVIQGDRVVGLLTRRAVDRSMSHKLEQRVEQVMETGTGIFVHPDDSLETLRQKMMDTGWGQMPVLDDKGKMIGIVTRTDLIRRWGERPRNHRHQQLILQQLQQILPGGLWSLIQQVAREAQEKRLELYLVGGLVRDVLLNLPNLDIDFVVEGDAIELVQHLCQRFGGEMRYHPPFGTAKWLIAETTAKAAGVEYSAEWPAFLDFATARSEFYKEPTALPTVRQSSIKQDLHRRDFTINSMAIRLSPEPMGDLIDYYNGERDLNAKLIRVLHSLSFVDDPTRIIRAVRFEQRLNFQIETRTKKLLSDALPFLDRVTGERVRNELEHILKERDPLRGLLRLDELGVLRQIFAGFMIDAWFEAAYQMLLSAKNVVAPWSIENYPWDVGLWLLLTMRLSAEELDTLSQRLLMPRFLMKPVKAIQTGYQRLLDFDRKTPPSKVVETLEKMEGVCWLALWAAVPSGELRQIVVQFVTTWQHIKSTVSGKQLIALGIAPGPSVGIILKELRRAWLDGEIVDSESEKIFLEQILRGNNPRPRD